MPRRTSSASSSATLPQKGMFDLSAQPTSDNDALVLTIRPPQAPLQPVDHMPCEVVLVIDVSYSMADEALPPDGGERTGLSILDLTKHAAKTVIASLNDGDLLGVVTFSNGAKVVQGLTAMSSAAKELVTEKIEALDYEGSTNLWAGLREGLRQFEPSSNDLTRTRAVFLLTDGQPNCMCPSVGYVAALRPLLDREREQNRPPIQINTFGFGYNIRSGLLSTIAELSGGTYGFIPDCGMIGTVFIHAAANLFATCATNARLRLELPAESQATVAAGLKHTSERRGAKQYISVPLGSLLYGQPRDVVLRASSTAMDTLALEASLEYYNTTSCVTEDLVTTDFDDALYPLSSDASLYQMARASMCELLSSLFPEGPFGERHCIPPESLDMPRASLKALADQLQGCPLPRAEGVQSLLDDLAGFTPTGQVCLALSKEEFYCKWGVHYLPSLLSAHQKQYCNSFKDLGPLQYGRNSSLFLSARDRLNEVFDNMEIKASGTPSYQRYTPAQAPNAFIKSMGSRFNNRYSDCFAGECRIQMASGLTKTLHDLRPGDDIQSQSGVRKVAEILKNKAADIEMRQIDGLVITPWHPLCHRSAWTFPAELQSRTVRYSGYIYSLLLEPSDDPSQHTAVVGGTVCTTMGHGILDKQCSGDVRGHEFYGDYGVVYRALQTLPRDESGARHKGLYSARL